jgi:quaternary ammonium compound-resistance protein SugE
MALTHCARRPPLPPPRPSGRSVAQAWLILLVAGALEIGWAIGLKYTGGWGFSWPSVLTFVAAVLSFVMLSYALRSLPVGTAYAVWVGIGAAGVAVIGIFLFGENASPVRLGCIALIIAGVAGLKLSEG